MTAALETPSKAAAQAISSLDLSLSPSKPTSLTSKFEDAAKPEVKVVDRDALAKRFVGDLDCEEKDEPILQET
jgi:ribonucleoside-diphosphate reductase subunit M2